MTKALDRQRDVRLEMCVCVLKNVSLCCSCLSSCREKIIVVKQQMLPEQVPQEELIVDVISSDSEEDIELPPLPLIWTNCFVLDSQEK